MYKIAVIGDKDSISGFSAVGMTPFPVEDGEAAFEMLMTLVGTNYGVIFVTENVYEKIRTEYKSVTPLPAVIPIPGAVGNTGAGMRDISKFVERAVGSDIIS